MVSSCLLVITSLCDLPHECAAPTDSLLTNRTWQKLWDITFEIRLQRRWLPSCCFSLSLTQRDDSCCVTCYPTERLTWQEPVSVAKVGKDLIPTKSHRSGVLKWIHPRLNLPRTAAHSASRETLSLRTQTSCARICDPQKLWDDNLF